MLWLRAKAINEAWVMETTGAELDVENEKRNQFMQLKVRRMECARNAESEKRTLVLPERPRPLY